MNQAFVDRAIEALAKVGATRNSPERQSEKPAPPQRTQLSHLRENAAVCGSPECTGCYDVGNGRKIHPPKCGENFRAWRERWEEKGKVQ